jgi:hypothetical protein
MWILFFIIITSPGQFKVEVLDTYKTPTAEQECKTMKSTIEKDFLSSYPSSIDRDTYGLICLKQKEREA